MQHIAVIGTGYVGLVAGTCFAELGNHVVCADVDAARIEMLKAGKIPFYEPGLAEMVLRNQHGGRLEFSADVAAAVTGRGVVFITVGTPVGDDGRADLTQVREAARTIARALDGPKIVVNKSTVPVETADLVASLIREFKTADYPVTVVSNPEFLSEGSAIANFMKPDRIVVGVDDGDAEALLRDLYAPLEAPIFVTDPRTAEMIKYTANAFLATRISFINEIANICDQVGADIKDVVAGVGSDARIGHAFLNAGLGFGGSCFPKDLLALARIAEANEIPPRLLHATFEVNRNQVAHIFRRLEALAEGLRGKRIGLLGLAYKPNTDDVRGSPAVLLAEQLHAAGALVVAHDPVAIPTARLCLGDRVRYVESSYEATNDADAVVIATDWNEYKQLDFQMLFKLMRGRLIFDARNIYDPDKVASFGFRYAGVGRTVAAGSLRAGAPAETEAKIATPAETSPMGVAAGDGAAAYQTRAGQPR